MPRKPRLEFPGAIYHINNRGNHQEYTYRDDDDRKLFLKLLETTIQRMNWICHAYCLMGNHYLLIVTNSRPGPRNLRGQILDFDSPRSPGSSMESANNN